MKIVNSIQHYVRMSRFLFPLLILAAACSGSNSSESRDVFSTPGKLKVVATTSIVGDVVEQVGGGMIDLEVLLPVGTDPHGFEPRPHDIAKLTQADVVFINGAGLEAFLEPLLEGSGGEFRIVDLSQEIQLLHLNSEHGDVDENFSGNFDPHIWMDPNRVILWVMKITSVLSEFDKENSDKYQTNANGYIRELENLDIWIKEKVDEIPINQRKIVTDHLIFSYFAEVYGFEQVGAAIPAFSTQAQPSAQQLAELEDSIREKSVKVIFVGESINPNLARRIAEDTGINLVFIHTGTLTKEGGAADSYIRLIRYNVNTIVNSLR